MKTINSPVNLFLTAAMAGATLTTALLAAVNEAKAVDTYYPLESIEIIKHFSDPLSDPDDCNGGGGLIAEIGCHLSSFGVDGVGDFEGVDGCKFYIHVEASSQYGYDFKLMADADCSAELNQRKHFMNYWFSEDSLRGRVELGPGHNDEEDSNATALFMEWDSTNQSAQTLKVKMFQAKTAANKSWENRDIAYSLDATINAELGIAYGTVSVNEVNDDESAAYVLRFSRDSNITLIQGKLCTADLSDCAGAQSIAGTPTGEYAVHCVENSDNSERSGELIESEDLLSGIVGNSACLHLKDTFPSTNRGAMPSQNQLHLFSSLNGMSLFR